MTSPDLPAPVSLTLHAVNENDLVDAAIAAFRVQVPEWVPQEGATEVLLMESLALVIGQQVYTLNQLPRVVLDGLIAIRGFQRKPAVAASGQIQVTVSASTLGTRTLPVGARFRVQLPAGGTVDVLAAETLQINPADSLTATVNVIAATPGSLPNGITPPAAVVVVDTFSWVESAVVLTTFTGGDDPETDAVFYTRVAAAFRSSSAALVVDSQFAITALSVPGVSRAKAYSLWDGTGSPGTEDAGHMSVLVAGPDGSNVSSAIKAAVLSLLTLSAVAGLTVHVLDFTKVLENIAVTYVLQGGFTASVVTAAVDAELRGWLDPATWPFGSTFTNQSQIILRLGRVAGVADITSVSGWLPISGGTDLPQVVGVTITQI